MALTHQFSNTHTGRFNSSKYLVNYVSVELNTLYYVSLEFRIYSLMFGNGHCLRTPIVKEKPAGTISKHNDWLEINTSSNSICHCFALTRIA